LAVGVYSVVALRKPETNRRGPLNGNSGVKAKTSLRDIQDDAAVVWLEIDIGKPFHRHPWSLTAFRLDHWHYSPLPIFGWASPYTLPSSRAEDGLRSPLVSRVPLVGMLDCTKDGCQLLLVKVLSRAEYELGRQNDDKPLLITEG
jgi:hypothetical protein